MEFLEHKTDFFCFLSLTEGTEVFVNYMEHDVWEARDKITGALNYGVESWY